MSRQIIKAKQLVSELACLTTSGVEDLDEVSLKKMCITPRLWLIVNLDVLKTKVVRKLGRVD